ncbi:MAG: D-alanyl-D-alanine carboxypeptidase [Rhizobiaceae bacterium]|nr:D-alanyl-D-alanine carboxypeptidase [Rhizobiaceae bacterium]
MAAVAPASAASSKYAAIVVDARTGKTLFSAASDEQRYPASLTKMMTLYMTFEALEAGRIKKTTPVPFSAQASAKPPTKLGVRPGGSVSVETAIYGLVTKSANDAAAALGELLAGSEQAFARKMTAKARALGMSRTTFRNASGLPDANQKTTAHDMAILGLALRRDFPQYYAYFSTKSFTYGRQRLGNHNRLLGRVKGVDGIKTGYTRASGFNLVTSVQDGDRRLVAVVMGGTSGRARDDHMAELIKTYLPKAATRGGAPLVASASGGKTSAMDTLAKVLLPKRKAPTPQAKPEVEEFQEVAVAEPEMQPLTRAEEETLEEPQAAEPMPAVEQAFAEPTPAPAPLPAKKSTKAAKAAVEVDPVQTASVPAGWAIQVASSPSEPEARQSLDRASKQASKLLASASPFTVPFEKGGVTYYRARFGGFASKTAAWNACGALKKKKIDCYAVQQ